MKRKIVPAVLVENTCHNCPHMRYDSYYSMSTDSGYDCLHEDSDYGRIADDYEITQYQNKKDEAERLPLFPEIVEDPHPLSIPDWCPLEDAS